MMKCPNTLCGRTGDDIGLCGSHALCPRQAVPIEPTDVVLHCDLCDYTRCVPAETIIRGKALSEVHMCLQEKCQARPVPTATLASPQPAPKAATDGKGKK